MGEAATMEEAIMVADIAVGGIRCTAAADVTPTACGRWKATEDMVALPMNADEVTDTDIIHTRGASGTAPGIRTASAHAGDGRITMMNSYGFAIRT
jgi:hypothetical protein